MTGTVELERIIDKLTDMISEGTNPSPKNQELLNDLCHKLVISQAEPLSEFVDTLIERFMYPRLPPSSLMSILLTQESIISESDEEAMVENTADITYKYETFDLGHPRILELIIIRQKLQELKSSDKNVWKSTGYIPKILTKVQQVYVLLVHLLKVLSDHIEVENHAEFYREIVVNSISDFQRAFESFKTLDFICQRLIKNVTKSGKSDQKIFNVENSLLELIKDFIEENTKWYDDILLQSIAFKEFSLTEGKSFLENPGLSKRIIHQTKFENFLDKRKSRLKISSRRVF